MAANAGADAPSGAPPPAASVYQCALSILDQMQPELTHSSLERKFADLHVPVLLGAPNNLTSVSAKKRKNQGMNRYSNVLPYDHNCVKVGACGDDLSKRRYVNASLLQAAEDDPAQWQYIATQGPLVATVADFWLMIIENECRAIVMLTRITEETTAKCSQYFPYKEGETFEAPGTSVRCVLSATSKDGSLELRSLNVIIDGVTEEGGFNCMHYLLNSWPDHGTPKESQCIRTLLRSVNQVTLERTGPACVHCSAGIGRTGTYIAIDIILKRLQALEGTGFTRDQVAASLDVDQLVKDLRQQRKGMVQTAEQLEYVYTTLVDCVQELVLLDAPNNNPA